MMENNIHDHIVCRHQPAQVRIPTLVLPLVVPTLPMNNSYSDAPNVKQNTASTPQNDSERLAFFLQYSNNVLCTLDQNLTIITISENCANLIGSSASSLVNTPFPNLLPDNDTQLFCLAIEGQHDEPIYIERIRLQHHLRYFISVDVHCQVAENNSGYHLVLRDIADQQDVANRISSPQEETQLLNDSVTHLVSRHTLDGRILFASPAAQYILGLAGENLIGYEIFDLVHHDDVGSLTQQFADLQPNDSIKTVVYRVRHQLGYYIWLESQLRLMADGEVVAVSRDISALKRAQAQVRQQTRLMLALEAMGRAVTSTLDLDEVLARLLQSLKTLLSSENVAVLLPYGDEWEIVANSGIGADVYLGERFPTAVFQEIVEQRRTITTSGPANSGHIPLLANGNDRSLGLRSMILGPMLMGDEVVGLIGGSHRQPDAFDDGDVQLVNLAANWAAIAVHNAHLFKRSRQRGEQLRRLSIKIIDVQEAERARLSRELHDESGQALTALSINLGLVRQQIAEISAEIAPQLDDAIDLIHDTLQRLVRLAHAMHPVALEKISLHSAINSLCSDFERHTKISVSYTGYETTLDEQANITLYRFVQEALTNIGKYAMATEVNTVLSDDDSTITLCVTDNGIGMATTDPEELNDGGGKSLGLVGMRERLALLNGSLTIESALGQGTTLTATIPKHQEDRGDLIF